MSIHKSVLLKEAIEMLNLKSGAVVVDATLGGGGHSQEILKIIKNGKLIAIDADKEAINNFGKETDERIILVNDNFANLEKILKDLEIEKVDAILADLGWSSDQLVGKGMSFQKDEKLDMRLSLRTTKLTKYENANDENLSAKDIVNDYSQEDLGKIIKEFGEEKFWRGIARKIVEYRKEKKIETTQALAEIIAQAIPKRYENSRISPATKTFQALRIAVNGELENLEKFIPQAIEKLNSKGRLAIISFHSLEDRIVKNIFRENARGCICPPDFPQCVCGKKPKVRVISKKPIMASEKEMQENPRARSAKMRVCEKI